MVSYLIPRRQFGHDGGHQRGAERLDTRAKVLTFINYLVTALQIAGCFIGDTLKVIGFFGLHAPGSIVFCESNGVKTWQLMLDA